MGAGLRGRVAAARHVTVNLEGAPPPCAAVRHHYAVSLAPASLVSFAVTAVGYCAATAGEPRGARRGVGSGV